ncbi:energy transducer TonB [Glaciecola sp. XM2]|uniref:energy transducer TonB n=1 Tax=Glaciecola sp. XM2 TaxID=1914931 RepID=UPI001BDDDEA7|nr:energy transducer TonB [Glaciecola sp. XM2]MBT1449780.1 energy transducer TonB [Glaciecola sp. XM2]
MQNTIGIMAAFILMSGCASTHPEKEYSHLSVTQDEMQSSKWSQLNRFPARYPREAVFERLEGCATIEYVITPQNEVKDITVVASTNKYFSKAARDVINNWNWSELPKSILAEPVKTQTRFDFCFDKPNQPCKLVTPKYSCPSDDIIYSTGSIIKRVRAL